MARWVIPRTFAPHYQAALAGSLHGTIVFGVLMSALGTMPMIAMLVGSENFWVAWLVHLVNGAIFSVPFALLLANFPRLPPMLLGLGWGLALWVGGALIIMPLWLGMPDMVLNLSVAGPWWSLAGHTIYGYLAGLTVQGLSYGEPLRSKARTYTATARPVAR